MYVCMCLDRLYGTCFQVRSKYFLIKNQHKIIHKLFFCVECYAKLKGYSIGVESHLNFILQIGDVYFHMHL